MTIERLQELLVIIENGAFEYSEEDYTAEQLDKAMDDIIHLINVEIWRMNLIEEDVKEAIETLECIYPSRKEIMSGEYPEVAEAIDIATEVLKAYQPVRENRTTEPVGEKHESRHTHWALSGRSGAEIRCQFRSCSHQFSLSRQSTFLKRKES